MSLRSRREYLRTMRERYAAAHQRSAKARIIDEVVDTLQYHRKYAIQVLGSSHELAPPATRSRRQRPLRYLEALPVIQTVWEALDYPCAERLQPVLLDTAKLLAAHGELTLTPLIRTQLNQISRATLARRLAHMPSPKSRRALPHQRPGARLRSEVPVGRYDWDESRVGSLELDLVEHNGGDASGQYAYTLTVTDVVTGYSRRRAVLGRGQLGVLRELERILAEFPFAVWALHSDSGSEFLNAYLIRFAKDHHLRFFRSRPYQKNDNPHVEQKNRQFVREIVGYGRYQTPQDVEWLNQVYATLDLYANLFLPMRKVVFKQREGSHVRKRYDQAMTPVQRLLALNAADAPTRWRLQHQRHTLNPLALHRELERLLAQGPRAEAAMAASPLG